jgi:hypothetical protein
VLTQPELVQQHVAQGHSRFRGHVQQVVVTQVPDQQQVLRIAQGQAVAGMEFAEGMIQRKVVVLVLRIAAPALVQGVLRQMQSLVQEMGRVLQLELHGR